MCLVAGLIHLQLAGGAPDVVLRFLQRVCVRVLFCACGRLFGRERESPVPTHETASDHSSVDLVRDGELLCGDGARTQLHQVFVESCGIVPV